MARVVIYAAPGGRQVVQQGENVAEAQRQVALAVEQVMLASDEADRSEVAAAGVVAATDKIKADELTALALHRWVPGNGFYVGDAAGNYILSMDGSIATPTGQALQAAGDLARSASLGLQAIAKWVPGSAQHTGDAAGNYVAQTTAAGVAGATGNAAPKIYLVIAHGQSLTNGTSPALTGARGDAGLSMFGGGVRVTGAPGDDTAVIPAGATSYLVPLASATAETFLPALAEYLHDVAGAKVVAVSTGVNGKAYYYLQKGMQPYTNLIACVTAANALALAAGAKLEVIVCWQHGEADYPDSLATYRANLDDLVGDLTADIPPITGQETVHVFAGQSPSLSQSNVPLAAFDKAKATANFHLIGPLYDLPLADAQHPTAYGQHHLGLIYGRAIKRVVFDRLTWTPFQPKTAAVAGAVITVTMEGQTGLPQIDTAGVSDRGTAKGFEIFDDSGSPPAITAVAATATGYTITLAGSWSATGKKLRTAWTAPGATTSPQGSIPGARTNLCDQDGLTDTITTAKALPKRCVIAEIPVT